MGNKNITIVAIVIFFTMGYTLRLSVGYDMRIGARRYSKIEKVIIDKGAEISSVEKVVNLFNWLQITIRFSRSSRK